MWKARSEEVTCLCQCRLRALVAHPPPGAGKLDAAENHRQFGHRNALVGGVTAREGERAALQPAQVKCKAVALPRENLQAIAPTIAEDEQIAAEWVPAQVHRYDGCESVNALASVLRLKANPNPSGQSER